MGRRAPKALGYTNVLPGCSVRLPTVLDEIHKLYFTNEINVFEMEDLIERHLRVGDLDKADFIMGGMNPMFRLARMEEVKS